MYTNGSLLPAPQVRSRLAFAMAWLSVRLSGAQPRRYAWANW
nr:hypothetical protein [Verrucosispora sioxanthis]